MDPKVRFEALVEEFSSTSGVTLPGEGGERGFGSTALKVNGSIFAMLTRGGLVVKLPRDRVDALVASGTGTPFDANKGRPMKEWLTVEVDDVETWSRLARDALEFVRSKKSLPTGVGRSGGSPRALR